MTHRPFLLLLVLGGISGPASAGPAECGLMRDPDRRRACFAETERRPGECSLIRDGDQRRLCYRRAERR